MARRQPPITKTELKLIAQELDTSHRLLPELVKQKLWLIGISRQYLCEKEGLCTSFPVFRTVGLTRLSITEGEHVSPHILEQVEACKELRPEAVVSTTLNPHVAVSIASEQADKLYWTGGMFRGGLLHTLPVIIRYDIPLERVILFVPALIAFIRSIYSPEQLSKTRYRNRWGDLARVPYIFHELEQRQENEVIADVTGLAPTDTWYTEGSKSAIWLAREMLLPTFDPITHLKRERDWGSYVPPPFIGEGVPAFPEEGERPQKPRQMRRHPVPDYNRPTEEQLAKVEQMEKMVVSVREFFATPWQPK